MPEEEVEEPIKKLEVAPKRERAMVLSMYVAFRVCLTLLKCAVLFFMLFSSKNGLIAC